MSGSTVDRSLNFAPATRAYASSRRGSLTATLPLRRELFSSLFRSSILSCDLWNLRERSTIFLGAIWNKVVSRSDTSKAGKYSSSLENRSSRLWYSFQLMLPELRKAQASFASPYRSSPDSLLAQTSDWRLLPR